MIISAPVCSRSHHSLLKCSCVLNRRVELLSLTLQARVGVGMLAGAAAAALLSAMHS